jgi:hypothetical protein
LAWNQAFAGAAPGKPCSLFIYDILANKSRGKHEIYSPCFHRFKVAVLYREDRLGRPDFETLMFQLQVNEALPVNVPPLTGVAVIVTGVPTAAVQVAVTCGAWGADSWTEGSLAVQLEFTRAAVTAGHPGPNLD